MHSRTELLPDTTDTSGWLLLPGGRRRATFKDYLCQSAGWGRAWRAAAYGALASAMGYLERYTYKIIRPAQAFPLSEAACAIAWFTTRQTAHSPNLNNIRD